MSAYQIAITGNDSLTTVSTLSLPKITTTSKTTVITNLSTLNCGIVDSTGSSLRRRKFYRLPKRLLWLIFCLFIYFLIFKSCSFNSLTVKNNVRQDNETLAQNMERNVRILCWVMTTPINHKIKAISVLKTWGKRCNSLYFVTSESAEEFSTILVDKQKDKYEFLWGKTKEAFKYIHENLSDKADWFMKADDDTYVFVENLRHMLYPYSTTWPIYFGFNYKLFTMPNKKAAYMSGGSGYVLSREALRRFVEEGLTDSTKCRQEDNQAEDVEIGNCLYKVGVYAGDSRDVELKNRFEPFAPYTTLISNYNGLDFWYFKYSFYNPRTCMNCLSKYPVAFHYVSPDQLYVYEFFNYEFEAYGLPQYQEELPLKLAKQAFLIPAPDNHLKTE